MRWPPWFPPVMLAVLSAGCQAPAQDPAAGGRQIALEQRMAAPPDAGFARVTEPRAFDFPADHAAHPDYATEWWYFTGNLQSAQGRAFGYQLTLFRVGLKPGESRSDSAWRTGQLYMGHLAISDIANRRHYSAERFSRAAAGLAGAQAHPLRIWLGPWQVSGSPQALFPLRLQAATADMQIDLTLAAGSKPPVLQGEHGYSRKGAAAGNASYYYSYTRLPARGTIRLGEQTFTVSGNTWFDREWSSSALATDQAGWDWFALHLDDGRDLMFYRMRGKDGRAQRFSEGVLVAADGSSQRLPLDSVELQATAHWESADGVSYPTRWSLRIPERAIDVEVEAAFGAQEMPLTVRYWEGAVRVRGSHTGSGYLELSGYAR